MRAFWIGLGLACASAAVASEPAHGDAPAAHDAAPGAHGDAPAAHGAGGHHTFTDDDDHDGTANWRDADSESYVVFKLGSQMGAFLIVVGIIGAFGRRPVADFLSDRALAIRKTLTDSAQARDDAKAHAAALSDRLGKLEAEIGQMRADAETEARQEAARLVERAEEEARRIEQVAERKIRDEVARAQVALRREAVDLAVQLAESTLRASVSAGDQQRLAKEFLESLKQDGVSAHG